MMGFSNVFMEEGYESDDIIASLVIPNIKSNLKVLPMVVSSDKDLMQIVEPRVAMVTPGKPAEKEGPDQVFRKTGVRPDQVVDWLALMGDNADNISGVPGVGAKTAAKWLAQWNSLDNLWLHAAELQPDKLRQALLEKREVVLRNARLIRLRLDLESFASVEVLARRPPDVPRLRAFYEEMEFHSLAEKISQPMLL